MANASVGHGNHVVVTSVGQDNMVHYDSTEFNQSGADDYVGVLS